MTKKDYLKPAVCVVAVQHETLLAASNPSPEAIFQDLLDEENPSDQWDELF